MGFTATSWPEFLYPFLAAFIIGGLGLIIKYFLEKKKHLRDNLAIIQNKFNDAHSKSIDCLNHIIDKSPIVNMALSISDDKILNLLAKSIKEMKLHHDASHNVDSLDHIKTIEKHIESNKHEIN